MPTLRGSSVPFAQQLDQGVPGVQTPDTKSGTGETAMTGDAPCDLLEGRPRTNSLVFILCVKIGAREVCITGEGCAGGPGSARPPATGRAGLRPGRPL